MQIKLNCENRVLIQGRITELSKEKFTLKSNGLKVLCRVDCKMPSNLKDNDWVTIQGKLRYSNDHDTHKLIVERMRGISETSTPINQIVIEGYPLEIVKGANMVRFMLRHNVLNSKGELYRCLVECFAFSKVAERIGRFIENEKLYLVVGELVGKDKKVQIDVEYVKDNTAIIREY